MKLLTLCQLPALPPGHALKGLDSAECPKCLCVSAERTEDVTTVLRVPGSLRSGHLYINVLIPFRPVGCGRGLTKTPPFPSSLTRRLFCKCFLPFLTSPQRWTRVDGRRRVEMGEGCSENSLGTTDIFYDVSDFPGSLT